MERTVRITIFNHVHEVPADLTVMTAMEYLGYRSAHESGCRNGVCGACVAVYRTEGERGTHVCLSCQTPVRDRMQILELPAPRFEKRAYELETLSADQHAMRQIYPEIDACVGCNACSRACPEGLNVRQFVALARQGDFLSCAEESFACVMCGSCTSRCPAHISPSQVAMLARRLYGRFLSPSCAHLETRIGELRSGVFDAPLARLERMSEEELRVLYNNRDIET